MEVAANMLGTPGTVRLPIPNPIRTDDEIEAATAEEARAEQMMLDALREEDRIIAAPQPVPTMRKC
jgi:hypothetical protein